MLPHKRGDSFDRLANIPDTFTDGYFVGWTVTSQVRTSQYGKLLANLECVWVDPVTTRVLSIKSLSTSSWSLGTAEMDIQFVRNTDGYTISTSTVSFEVVKDITREDA